MAAAAGLSAADGGLGVRRAFWWLEDKNLGRVSVGRHNAGGPVGTIDLGGVSTPSSAAPADVGGGFIVAGTTTRMSAVINPSYGNDRVEGIRYDSPTIGGFVVQAFWGEDDIWTASIRYAGEAGGFRVAAGIGYEAQNSSPTQTVQLDNGARNLDNEWSASLALMHVGTGLFVQGQYSRSEFLNGADAKYWLVQGGISKNWFGLGNTSFYGEYGEATDFIRSGPAAAGAGSPAAPNFVNASSEVTFLGHRRCAADRRRSHGAVSWMEALRHERDRNSWRRRGRQWVERSRSGSRRRPHPVLIWTELTLQELEKVRCQAPDFFFWGHSTRPTIFEVAPARAREVPAPDGAANLAPRRRFPSNKRFGGRIDPHG